MAKYSKSYLQSKLNLLAKDLTPLVDNGSADYVELPSNFSNTKAKLEVTIQGIVNELGLEV